MKITTIFNLNFIFLFAFNMSCSSFVKAREIINKMDEEIDEIEQYVLKQGIRDIKIKKHKSRWSFFTFKKTK